MDNPKLSGFIAHSANSMGQVEPLEEHLGEIARHSQNAAQKYRFQEASSLAFWLGWWHDAGKAQPDVQAFLHQPTKAHGPDHSSVGALQAWGARSPLAFCVAGHHGGLMDSDDLRQRMLRKEKEQRIQEALKRAQQLLPPEIATPPPFPSALQSRQQVRRCAFFIRMLHSALVDSDCLGAERHFNPEVAGARQRYPSLQTLWGRFEAYMQQLLKTARKTPVNEIRGEIFNQCLQAAEQLPGFFNLTVPTGGGKTLAGMGFALKHALGHSLERVIVALPYTSIIEQNADVYRTVLGAEAILEHHSAVESSATSGDESDLERWQRLAAENWDAPVIVTTTVQLFESLFAHKNGRIRKLHNVARSVVILDEAQTLPINLLEPTLDALRFLVENYNTTVVLSSATQPAFNARPGFNGIQGAREMIPNHAAHFQRMRRVSYTLPESDARWSWETLATHVSQHRQALVVLNTIRDTLTLLDALDDDGVFYLSSNLCGAHRRSVLEQVRQRLREDMPCRLISTQVVEAGVDLDFPIVYRAMGPLDRIAQAAGRCNREGKRERGEVIVFRLEEGGMPPGSYKAGADTAEMMLRSQDTLDLNVPDVFRRYFQLLYDAQPLDLKDPSICGLLERFQFEEVGKRYRFIPDDTVPVVVHRYEPEHVDAILDELRAVGRPVQRLVRQLQPYLVNVRRRTFDEMKHLGLITEPIPEVYVWEGRYDALRGLVVEGFQPGDLVL